MIGNLFVKTRLLSAHVRLKSMLPMNASQIFSLSSSELVTWAFLVPMSALLSTTTTKLVLTGRLLPPPKVSSISTYVKIKSVSVIKITLPRSSIFLAESIQVTSLPRKSKMLPTSEPFVIA